MKKFISVALVASMVASMGVTAFADTKYPYKDKDLEFYGDYFYDGRGADEFWVPIIVNKNGNKCFITDNGSVDSKEAFSNAVSAYNNARNRYNAYNYIATETTKTDGIFKDLTEVGAVDSKISDELDANYPGIKALQVSKLSVNGNSYDVKNPDKGPNMNGGSITVPKTYLSEVAETYKLARTAALADMQSQVDIIAFFGGATSANLAAEVSGWASDSSAAANLEQGNRNEADKLDSIVNSGDIKAFHTNPSNEYIAAYDDIEDVNDVEISLKVKRGSNLVADYDIDEVEELGGIYCVSVELNDNLVGGVAYVDATLKMETGKNRKIDEQDVRYNYYSPTAYSVSNYQMTVGDLENGYEVNGGDNYINLVDFNDKYTTVFLKKNVEWLELEDNNGFHYEVDIADQGRMVMIYNNNAIDAVTNVASEDAVLTFYNFEARPIFDFSGKVTITPPDEYENFDIETLHVYTYEKDGSLKEVKHAKVGEDGDTIEFRTNQLGKYVLSTEELTLLSDAERAALEALKEAEAKGETTENGTVVEENKQNPGTGL